MSEADRSPFTPTESQEKALRTFARHLCSSDEREVLIIRGAAGTGKSRLIAALANAASRSGFLPILAAPTGRAARILGERARPHSASTIHRLLYSFEKLDEVKGDSEQPLFMYRLKASEDPGNVVYLIDEASMVGDHLVEDTNLRFGSGRLLSDLLHFVFWAHPGGRRKLVLIGDHCQLPPIGSSVSPALDADYLRAEHRCKVGDVCLTDIVRQKRDSGIIAVATGLRDMIDEQRLHSLQWPSGEHIRPFWTATQFEEALRSQWQLQDPPHIVCFTNSRVRDWNRWTRSTLHGRSDDPTVGDRLLVIQNHGQSGLLNGDFAELVAVGSRVTRTVKGVDLHYREVKVRFESETGLQAWEGKILENLLLSPERTLSDAEHQARWILFKLDHPGLRPDSIEFKNAIVTDPWWNCLFAKFGYATTCHKAQGGEWPEVFVDPETESVGRSRNIELLRWLYTVVTRAKRRLTLLSPPSWSAGDGLRPPQTSGGNSSKPIVVPNHERTSPEGLLVALLHTASTERGWAQPRVESFPFQLRCTWRDGGIQARLDVRFRADGQPSLCSWSGTAVPPQAITVDELLARWWLAQVDDGTDTVPAGVREVLARCRTAALRHGLEMRVEMQQFAFMLILVDRAQLAVGPAIVRASFNSKGMVTGHQEKAMPQPLRERCHEVLGAGAAHG